jgi:hypothetical protein
MQEPYIIFYQNMLNDYKYTIMPLIKMILKINLKIKLNIVNKI